MVSGSSSGDYQLTDEDSTGGFDVYPTYNLDAEEDSESEEDKKGKRKASQNPINSRSSIKKMKGLVDRLSEQRRGLVCEMEFKGLLHLRVITRSNKQQSMWLMSNINEKASTVIIDATRDLPFDAEDVGEVLRVPSVGSPIARNGPPHVGDVVREILVFYLDNLNQGDKNVAPNVFPRCNKYNQKTIAEIIDEDTSTGKDSEIVVCGHLLFVGLIINKVEQFCNKCQTVVQEVSTKGARLNKKHAMGWDDIGNNTKDVIFE
ncbi:hypothetical protein D1007_29026 [Hordeum vulgare]|nr:hypothetical protein D1007_29026 [Hordeum vulgare]